MMGVPSVEDTLKQGSPTPRPQTSTGPLPVRNRAAQQEVSGRRASKASSVFTAAPHGSHYRLNYTPAPAPGLWKKCLPRNRSLEPKRLGTAALKNRN